MHPGTRLLLAATCVAGSAAAESLPFFVGTDADGIYAASLDTETGGLSQPQLVGEMRAPGFLWVHPTLPVLYAVGGPGPESELVAFGMGEDRRLARLASVGTGGKGACYVTVSPDGRYAAAAHYGSGSVAVFALAEDGTPGEAVVTRHTGRSVDASRQTGPHAHSVRFSADGRALMAADLGTDKLCVYSVSEGGGLEPGSPPAIDLPPGSGPRHFVFAPEGAERADPQRDGRHDLGRPDRSGDREGDANDLGGGRRPARRCRAGVGRDPLPPRRALRLREQPRARRDRLVRVGRRGVDPAGRRGLRRDLAAELPADRRRPVPAGGQPEVRRCRGVHDRPADRPAGGQRPADRDPRAQCIKFLP